MPPESITSSTAAGIVVERHGRGSPLLLLHGIGGSRYHWTPVRELLRVRRELLLVDLPGHGESGPPPAEVPDTPSGYAQLLAGLLDEFDLASVDVAGNSLGGWTALELAKLGRARSVVAIAPAGLWRDRAPRAARLRLGGQYRLGQLCAPALPRLLGTAAGRRLVLGAVVANPWKVPPDAAAELASTYVGTADFPRQLAAASRERFRAGRELSVPVTVAWGEYERLIPPSARLRHELPPGTRYLTLEGCGHLAMWDNPRLVAHTILAGSRERSPSAAA